MAFVNKAASGPRQRLALMVLLKSFQKLGYLPRLSKVPNPIKRHITRQFADSLQLELNDLSPTTRSRYRQAIHKYLNVKPYRQGGDKVVAQVVRLSAATMSDPADLINVAIEELLRQQYELPAYRTLDDFVNHIRHQAHLQIYEQVTMSLTQRQQTTLASLLKRQDDATRHPFNQLKSLPQSSSLKEVRKWENHLTWLEEIIDPTPLLSSLSNTKVEQFAAEAYQLETGDMLDIKTEPRRYTLLLCLIYHMQVRTRDH